MTRTGGYRGVLIAGLALALGLGMTATGAAGATGPAQPTAATGAVQAAQPGSLPEGWSIEQGDDGPLLVWRPATALAMGGAGVQLWADGRSLGPAVVDQDGRRVSIALVSALRDPGSVQVRAAGRRLDRVEPAPAGTGRIEQWPDDADAEADAGTGSVAAAPVPDPGRPGPYRVTTGEYTAAGLKVAGLPAAVEMQAVVVAPVGAPGKRPLVLYLHGRHFTCYTGGPKGQASGDWPCPQGWKSIPSYRGYLQAQRLLASQGYVTVSIGANGINGQDFRLPDGGAAARSVLVRAHLALWARWAAGTAGAVPPAVPAKSVDLFRVLLVGHSRGGEGVNRAALDSASRRPPWRIAGQLLLAPTIFGYNPAPGVPTVVVLPYCDGDVFDLQGQVYVDAGRDITADPVLRSALLVRGANHNYFNAEWTPGAAVAPANDDWFEPTNPECGSKVPGGPRLTAAEQRSVGAGYAAAAAAVLIGRDERVLPLLDGSGARMASTGRARVLAHALGAERAAVVVPGNGGTLAATGAVRAIRCVQLDAQTPPDSTCRPDDGKQPSVSPHQLGVLGVAGEPQRSFAQVSWTARGGSATLATPRPVSLVGRTALAMRVFTAPGAPAAGFDVEVADAAGHRAKVGAAALRGLPQARGTGKAWARELRVPLAPATLAAAGVDPARIAAIRLLPTTTSGKIWLADAWGWQPGLSDRPAPALARADVGRVSVTEGDSGSRTVNVPVRITGPVGQGASVALYQVDESGEARPTATVVPVPPRATSLQVPITVRGNTLDDPARRRIIIQLRPHRELAVAEYAGGLVILDDDPSPAVTITTVAGDVTEGRPLVWRMTLARPSNVDVFAQFRSISPAAGNPELSTDDVPAQWLRDQGVEVPATPVPLSSLRLFHFMVVPRGATQADLTIPTVADSRSEPGERVALRAWSFYPVGPTDPAQRRLVGVVSDPK